MAEFVEATELDDADQRESIMKEILRYNEEDLDATWAVFCWLCSKVG